jgi:hypothetical protein
VHVSCLVTSYRTKSLYKGTVANRSFENLTKSKYFRTTTTNKNLIHEEIKSRLNVEMAAAMQVQNPVSSL